MSGSQGKHRSAREVTSAWIQAMLERALRRAAADGVLPLDPGDDPFAAFVRYITDARPVLCLATPLAHAESLVAELVNAHPESSGILGVQRFRRSAEGGFQQTSFTHEMLLVVPFHDAAQLSSLERFGHKLTVTDNPVFLGCRHPSQIPEILRGRIDAVVSLEPLGAEGFTELFERLFGEAPGDAPPGPEGEGWKEAVEPGDLHLPAREGLDAAEAEAWIRERIADRRRVRAGEEGPGLDDLHGMGEAKAVARDLVEEIRAVREGRLRWSDLDRGMLLAGPPGTGKTALARALAREADCTFVAATASAWQENSSLGEHLAAIRRTFEDARRRQPAIVFLDELDAVGNREKLDAHGNTYTRSVVNFLLEQLDGFGGREQLIVIGATNHPENVDPALRRSGRLDQVIQVPFPTATALAEIYRFQLRRHEEAGRLAEDVDLKVLGRLSVGLTGADVELLVRGAFRRARRRGGEDVRICQEDLVGELLLRPRLGSGHVRLGEEALRRLAVHQAGHVLARLTGPSQGKEIGYVSITPRSDGTMGHLRSVGRERSSWTRDQILQAVRVELAGRAAEEVVFGAEEVSDLAGGHGSGNDLAKATALVETLFTGSGLDLEGLLWPESLGAEVDFGGEGRVEGELRRVYEEVWGELEERHPLLEQIANLLYEEQEVSGERIRELHRG